MVMDMERIGDRDERASHPCRSALSRTRPRAVLYSFHLSGRNIGQIGQWEWVIRESSGLWGRNDDEGTGSSSFRCPSLKLYKLYTVYYL